MSYIDYIPEIGERAYEDEQAALAELARFQVKTVWSPSSIDWCYGESEFDQINRKMAKRERSYESARTAHLLGVI